LLLLALTVALPNSWPDRKPILTFCPARAPLLLCVTLLLLALSLSAAKAPVVTAKPRATTARDLAMVLMVDLLS